VGTFIGIVGGIAAIESVYILRGKPSGKAASYTGAVVAGGIIGSALSISRARRDFSVTSVAARLAGGTLAAVVESLLFYKLFDFYLPNPGLMLVVPLGAMMGERSTNRH
jgi:hypothetical protein